jgi:DNA-binding NarL/FixJ family response regulator
VNTILQLYSEEKQKSTMSKIRVALIEDHDLTRVGIRTALQQKEEIEIVGEAANAADGLKLLRTIQPDVAIVDIGLPDKDGIELTRELKAIGGDELATKVLILTLRDNKEAVLAAFAAGADSYCMKDIKYDNLLEAVRVTHNGNAWIDPAIARIVLQQAQQNPPQVDSTSGLKTNRTGEAEENEGSIEAYTLTERELEVLQLIVEGCSNALIAERLFITVGTVKTHVRNILNKLCADDRTQAAVRALRSGLVG